MANGDSNILAALAHIPIERRPDPLDLIRCISEPDLIGALGLGARTWDRMKAVGDVPDATQLSERRFGYRLTDVCDWLTARKKTPHRQPAAPRAEHKGAG